MVKSLPSSRSVTLALPGHGRTQPCTACLVEWGEPPLPSCVSLYKLASSALVNLIAQFLNIQHTKQSLFRIKANIILPSVSNYLNLAQLLNVFFTKPVHAMSGGVSLSASSEGAACSSRAKLLRKMYDSAGNSAASFGTTHVGSKEGV